jgi:hypothetical protein
MKDLLSGFIANWELFIGFLLVFIMLAGEKGVWGTLEPILEKAHFLKKILAAWQDQGDESR